MLDAGSSLVKPLPQPDPVHEAASGCSNKVNQPHSVWGHDATRKRQALADQLSAAQSKVQVSGKQSLTIIPDKFHISGLFALGPCC